MADTDSPLKRLVHMFITDFAVWLLQADVREIQPLNVELPAETLAADQVFQVTLADGRRLVLHIEFQGRGSRQPMRWRMLEYMARLACTTRLDIWSVVLYVGQGVGTRDTGDYQLLGPDGTPTLAWRYRVIRLWQMSAEELLALGRPALLALVGQTRIENPEVVFPEVIARMRSVPDEEMRGRLLSAMVSLMSEEEMVEMVERLLDREELLLDTPFLRRIRAEGQEAARASGRVEGRRRSILETLAWRFDPPISVYQQVERFLETVTDEAQLAELLATAVRAESIAAFQATLGQERRPHVSS